MFCGEKDILETKIVTQIETSAIVLLKQRRNTMDLETRLDKAFKAADKEKKRTLPEYAKVKIRKTLVTQIEKDLRLLEKEVKEFQETSEAWVLKFRFEALTQSLNNFANRLEKLED